MFKGFHWGKNSAMAVTQQRELTAGERIGMFRIERTLGIGGFGITYLAFDTGLNLQVAIKEYFPQNAWRDGSSSGVCCYAGDAAQTFQIGLQRFHKEGQILAQFKHPNIVGVRQMLSANNTAYLVMDYERGEELEAYLRRLGRSLTYQELENIFNPLLDGLRAVHDRGLLHLDIKPENIFLRADSTPVLIDFGGARHQLGQASRSVSFLVASDGYAPNEQYTGTQLQPTTDIYAVGATLYRCLTGKVPVDAPKRGVAMIDGSHDPLPPIHQVVSGGKYPETLLQTLDDALNMRVSCRPQSVRELQQRLFQTVSTESQLSPPKLSEPVTHQQPHPVTKERTPWLLPAWIVVGSAVVLLGAFYWRTASPPDASAELERLRHENQDLAKQLESTSDELSVTTEPVNISPVQAPVTSVDQTEPAINVSYRDEMPIFRLIDDYAAVSGLNDYYAALSFYTEPIDYYNQKSATHDFIVSESKRYAGVYAERQFQVVSTPAVEWLSDNDVRVTYRMSYDLCCKQGKGPVSGVNSMSMRLVQTPDGWKIAGVSSKKM